MQIRKWCGQIYAKNQCFTSIRARSFPVLFCCVGVDIPLRYVLRDVDNPYENLQHTGGHAVL